MIEIYVQGDLFTNDELDVLTSDQYRFKKLETLGFSPELVIMALIECGQNVGYNAVYDTIKYIIFSSLLFFISTTISYRHYVPGGPYFTRVF